MSTSTPIQTVIVGNGISGLNLAYKLTHDSKQSKESVVVVEKSRATGGRMATRRGNNGAVFDHGSQYYKGDRPELQQLHKVWSDNNLVRVWMKTASGSSKQPENHHCASTAAGMSSLAKHLASNIDVRLQHELKSVKQSDGGVWELQFNDQQPPLYAKQLIITAPTPAIKCSAVEMKDRMSGDQL